MRKSGVRGTPNVSALASLDNKKLFVLLWHYHDDDLPGPSASIDLTLTGLPIPDGTATLTQYRIDAEHSNAFESWKHMGSPQSPSPAQYTELEKAGQLAVLGQGKKAEVKKGEATLHVDLPRQAVALLVLEQ